MNKQMLLTAVLLALPSFSSAGMKEASKLTTLLLCGDSGPSQIEVQTELMRQFSKAGVAIVPSEVVASAYERSEEQVAAVRGKTAPGAADQIQVGNSLPPGDPLRTVGTGPLPANDSIAGIASQAWTKACPSDPSAARAAERWLKLVQALGAEGWVWVDVSAPKGRTSLGFKYFDKYGKPLWAGKPAASGKDIPDAVQKSVTAIYK